MWHALGIGGGSVRLCYPRLVNQPRVLHKSVNGAMDGRISELRPTSAFKACGRVMCNVFAPSHTCSVQGKHVAGHRIKHIITGTGSHTMANAKPTSGQRPNTPATLVAACHLHHLN